MPVRARLALGGVAAPVKAAQRNLSGTSLGLEVLVGAGAPKGRVAARGRRLKAAGHLSRVALHMPIDAARAVAAAGGAVEELALLRLTVLRQVHPLEAQAGHVAAHGKGIHLLMGADAAVLTPPLLSRPGCLHVLALRLSLCLLCLLHKAARLSRLRIALCPGCQVDNLRRLPRLQLLQSHLRLVQHEGVAPGH